MPQQMDFAMVIIFNGQCDNVISTQGGLYAELMNKVTVEVFIYMARGWTMVNALPTKNGKLSTDFTYFFQRSRF